MISVALVGNGIWGKNYIETVNQSGLGSIELIVNRKSLPRIHDDLRNKNLSPAARRLQVAKQIADELERQKIRASIVATHPPWTAAIAIELLGRGISVMAEKPFTFEEADLTQVERVCENKTPKPIFLINHQHLFSDAISHMLSLTRDRELKYIKASAGNLGPFRDYTPIFDYGPHDFSIAVYLFESALDLVHFESVPKGEGFIEKAKLLIGSRGTEFDITVWNHTGPKVHEFKVFYEDLLLTFNDFDPFGRLCVNGLFPSIPYCMPLTLSVRSFLENVLSQHNPIDSRYGTKIAWSYTPIFANIRSNNF